MQGNLHPYEYGGFIISPGYPGKPVVITRGGHFFRFAKDTKDAERQIRVFNHQEKDHDL